MSCRTRVPHGHKNGEVPPAVQVRPRARTVDGESDVPLATYDYLPQAGALANR